jgi:hypothetical protein
MTSGLLNGTDLKDDRLQRCFFTVNGMRSSWFAILCYQSNKYI